MENRYKCRCCGNFTLSGENEEEVKWDICPVCFWENDIFSEDGEQYSGANHMTLNEGRENFKKYKACSPEMSANVREPKTNELPENNMELPEGFSQPRFFKEEDFYKTTFNGMDYRVIGEDDVGNFMALDSEKRLFLLNTADKSAVYISKDKETFLKEIELYNGYGKIPFPENPTEEELAERESGFRKLMEETDENAFQSEETYWSAVAEEMGYGII